MKQKLQRHVEAKSSQVESYFRLGKRSLAKASEQTDPGPEGLFISVFQSFQHNFSNN